MTNSEGLLYYFGENEGSLSERVLKAMREYAEKQKEYPDFISINHTQANGILPEFISDEGHTVMLLFERSCLKNHFYAGKYLEKF